MSSKTTNLGLTKPAEDEFYDINVQNENMDIIDKKIGELESPAYTEATQTEKLVSGEKFTVALGKIAKAVRVLISHISTKATSTALGHVKLSDSAESTSAASAGVAATPKAVKTAYDLANENSEKIGATDISGLGDGTLTGAVDAVNQSLDNKANTNHAHDDRYYIKAQIDTVTSGSAQRINNSYIDAVSLSWYKNGKIVWITGTISVSKAIPAGAAFFFASGFPSRLKQLLGTAICYTGDPAGQHQRGSFYTYIEGDKLSCYGGGALETAPGAYTLNAFYILD